MTYKTFSYNLSLQLYLIVHTSIVVMTHERFVQRNEFLQTGYINMQIMCTT